MADDAVLAIFAEAQNRQVVLRECREFEINSVHAKFKVESILVRAGVWHVYDILAEPRIEVGRPVTTFNGSAMSAMCTCGHGSGCRFIVSQKPALGLTIESIRTDLTAGLAAGTAHPAAAHDASASWAKVNLYQMRIQGVV